MPEIVIFLLIGGAVGFLIGYIWNKFQKIEKSDSIKLNVSSYLVSIGELRVYRAYMKEIVTSVDHVWGDIGKKYFSWMLSEKKLAMVFEFEVDFVYNLLSKDFKVFDDINGVSIKMPRCKYDVKIKDFYFYDEQGTRLKILPEFLSSIFDGGVSEDEKNELVKMAIKQVEENDDKLNFKFNEESRVLKSEGPEVVLDEPLEPAIKKPQFEIVQTQKPAEISEEPELQDSEKVDSLPNIKNEIDQYDKSSRVLTPNNITQPEIDLAQSLESVTETVDELDILKDKIKAQADNVELSPRPKSRPLYISEPNFENKSEGELKEADGSVENQTVTSGIALTNSEVKNLQDAIKICWNVDDASVLADVKLKISMSLKRDGTVYRNSIRLLEASGSNADNQKKAFQTAKRAIIICGVDGYKLPADKYSAWREVEVVFDQTE